MLELLLDALALTHRGEGSVELITRWEHHRRCGDEFNVTLVSDPVILEG